VVARAVPDDGALDGFAARLAAELGPDARLEAGFHRDIRYATLVHFAAGIRDPRILVDAVERRGHEHLASTTIAVADLIRFRHDGRRPVREPLADARFRGGSA
jgi:hypothetical protein